ncbi:hypothetical protein, partial [Aeromonas caviae]|uniref:hypothetical protein n=1 Tax=Aeromonas caviae TaxID=648 RepID=UPI001CC6310B
MSAIEALDSQGRMEHQHKLTDRVKGVSALFMVLRGILGKWKLTDRVLVNWLSPNTPPPSPCCRRASY